jgi:glycosyltransferase involved in cell wall biosynthesis
MWAEMGLLVQYQPDVVHLVNSQNFIKIKNLHFLNHVKLIASFHGNDIIARPFEDKAWNRDLNELFNRAAILHFTSNWLKKEALLLGAPEKKLKVIYAGIDTQFFNPFSENVGVGKGRKIRLVSTGRLVPLKGYENVFPAIKVLLDEAREIEYVIIGQGDDLDRLRRLVMDFKISENVKFVGTKSKFEVRDLLSTADIYLHPSKTESLPGAVLEACAMRLPVIASNVGGLTEIIDDGYNGLLVPSCDPVSITSAIRYLIENPTFSQLMGKRARTTVVEKFSIEKETKDWQELYVSLV